MIFPGVTIIIYPPTTRANPDGSLTFVNRIQEADSSGNVVKDETRDGVTVVFK